MNSLDKFCFGCALLFSVACSSQIFSTDSARIAAYYNGTGSNQYETNDTLVDGKIITSYYYLKTPFDSLLYVKKGEHLTENKVMGIWVNDTIIPKAYRSYMVIAPDHVFFYHDSDVVYDTITYLPIPVERVLYGTWKISNDTFYTMITNCLQGCNTSWERDAYGWSTCVMVNGKLHKGPDAEEQRVFYAWRFRREETFGDTADESAGPRRHYLSSWRFGDKRTVSFDSLEYQSDVLHWKNKRRRFTGYLDGGRDAVSYYRWGKRAKYIMYYFPGKSKPRHVSKQHPFRMNGKVVNIDYDQYGRKTKKTIQRNNRPTKIIEWDRNERRRTVRWQRGRTQY